jgi:hypothetical protein
MIVRRSGLERFITGILSAPWSDGELSPELTMQRQFEPLETLSIGYGRSRPVNFDSNHFYVQHMSAAEYEQAMSRLTTEDVD